MLSQSAFPGPDQSALQLNRSKIHLQIENHIRNSLSQTISPSTLFKIFQQHCTDKILLEKLTEFNCAGFSFDFSLEEAVTFIDQLVDFSLSFSQKGNIKQKTRPSPIDQVVESKEQKLSLQDQLDSQTEVIKRLNQEISTLKDSLNQAQTNLQIISQREKGHLEEIDALNEKIYAASSPTGPQSSDSVAMKLATLSSSLQDRQLYIKELSSTVSRLKETGFSTHHPPPEAFESFLMRAKALLEQDKEHNHKIQSIVTYLTKKNQQLVEANKHFVVNLHEIKSKLEKQDSKEQGLKSLCIYLYNSLVNAPVKDEESAVQWNRMFVAKVFGFVLPFALYIVHLYWRYCVSSRSAIEIIS